MTSSVRRIGLLPSFSSAPPDCSGDSTLFISFINSSNLFPSILSVSLLVFFNWSILIFIFFIISYNGFLISSTFCLLCCGLFVSCCSLYNPVYEINNVINFSKSLVILGNTACAAAIFTIGFGVIGKLRRVSSISPCNSSGKVLSIRSIASREGGSFEMDVNSSVATSSKSLYICLNTFSKGDFSL